MKRTLGQIQIQNIVRSYQKAPEQPEEIKPTGEGREALQAVIAIYTTQKEVRTT